MRREGTVFTGVCLFTPGVGGGGGTPPSHNILLGWWTRGTYLGWWMGEGVPILTGGWGYSKVGTPLQGRYSPCQVRMGGTPR